MSQPPTSALSGLGPLLNAALDGDRAARWRVQVFVVTWIAYAGFYLTRQNYTVAQLDFIGELGWTKEQIGVISSTYLAVYAFGQFFNGVLVDKVGSRALLTFGFLLTGAMSIGLGFSSTIPMMTLLYGINGFAQSTGWPSAARAMTLWTPVGVRGRVMGLWGTNYQVGSAASQAVAAFLIGVAAIGWRGTFVLPGVAAMALAAMVLFGLRDRPEDLGLPPTEPTEPTEQAERSEQPGPGPMLWDTLEVLLQRRVLTLGLSYFCLKFVRYTFMFWIGFYLVEQHHLSTQDAAYAQVAFPLAGALGSVLSGWISDRFFQARRAPPALMMLGGLALGLVVLALAPPLPLPQLAALLGAVGVLLYGPDMLIAGTAAMDFGSAKAAGRVVGFVNGMGSLGAVVQGLAVGYVSDAFGWKAVFGLLVAMVCIGSAILGTLWSDKGR